MRDSKRTRQPKARNFVAIAARSRNGGAHDARPNRQRTRAGARAAAIRDSS